MIVFLCPTSIHFLLTSELIKAIKTPRYRKLATFDNTPHTETRRLEIDSQELPGWLSL